MDLIKEVIAKTSDQIKREERMIFRTQWEIAYLRQFPEKDPSRAMDLE